MRIVNIHHAWPVPSRARWGVLLVVVIIVLATIGASHAVNGPTVVVVIGMALLTALTGELVRLTTRYWLRIA